MIPFNNSLYCFEIIHSLNIQILNKHLILCSLFTLDFMNTNRLLKTLLTRLNFNELYLT